MRRWRLFWETGTNRYSELEYAGESIADVIMRWQGAHPTKDMRLIVSIVLLEATK